MAFMKYARASVVYPHTTSSSWGNVRRASQNKAARPSENLIDRASSIFNQQFDPNAYLLTHATIVSSVDVFSPPGVKTGAVMVEGFRALRKYSDFRVTAASEKFINNNLDCWSRGVLRKAYPTFIGGHNFVEHVQVEDLSKGRIIDAVARDIGESLYVDILIATDRKHRDLVQAIESEKMSTLSMGCSIDGSICTKCGHWAADETEMCPCIKYSKGNVFYDEQGHKNRVAELCGHESLDPTGGVTFIEASWVETPAFTGAVLRNILTSPSPTAKAATKLFTVPAAWSVPTKGTAKVARDTFLAGWSDADTEPTTDAPAAPAGDTVGDIDKKPPFKDIEDEVFKTVQKRVTDRFKKDLAGPTPAHDPSSNTNENVVKEASRRVYAAGLNALLRTASSDAALIDGIASYNRAVGVHLPVEVYRAALKVGRHDRYPTGALFKKACSSAMGREITASEVGAVLRLSMMISRR